MVGRTTSSIFSICSAAILPAAFTNAPFDFNPASGAFVATGAIIDAPALLISAVLTMILVTGIRRSAAFNFFMVVIKLAVVLLVIAVGVFYIDPANWRPFAPYGYSGISLFGNTIMGQHGPGGEPLGVMAGAAIVFYAYIGFDSVSTHAEEARNPSRDVPIGIIGSLILCTILYIAVAAVLTGMVPYQQIDIDAPHRQSFQSNRVAVGSCGHFPRRFDRHHLGVDGADVEPAAHHAGDGARRAFAQPIFRRGAPAFSHAVEVDNCDRHGGRFDVARCCRCACLRSW